MVFGGVSVIVRAQRLWTGILMVVAGLVIMHAAIVKDQRKQRGTDSSKKKQ